MNNEESSIGLVLKCVRIINDLTITETAKRVGLSQVYVGELEKGAKKPSEETLKKYSETFKIPVKTLEHFSKKNTEKTSYQKMLLMILKKIVAL